MRFIHIFSVSLIFFFCSGAIPIKFFSLAQSYGKDLADPEYKSPPVSPKAVPKPPSKTHPKPGTAKNAAETEGPFEFENPDTEGANPEVFSEFQQQDYQAELTLKNQTQRAELKGKIPQRAEIRSQIMGVQFVPSSPVLIPQ